MGTALLCWLLARRLGAIGPWALCAVAGLALSPTAISVSRLAVPENLAAVWGLAALLAVLCLPALVAAARRPPGVDPHLGPAVFFRLRELAPGDATARLADSSRARYEADGVEHYPKDDFPTRTVFGPVPGEALRLITCGGSLDRAVRSHRDDIVVYATRREIEN